MRKDQLSQEQLFISKRPMIALLFLIYLSIFMSTLGYFLSLPLLGQALADPTLEHTGIIELLGPQAFVVILSLQAFMGILVMPFLGYWSDILGRKLSILIYTVVGCLGFFLLFSGFFFHQVIALILGSMFSGIALGGRFIFQATIGDLSQKIPTLQSINRFSWDGLAIILAMLVGTGLVVSFPQWGVYCFLGASAVSVVNLILLIIFLKETRPVEKNSPAGGPLIPSQKWGSFLKETGSKGIRLFFQIPYPVKCLFFTAFFWELAWSGFYQYTYLFLPTLFHISSAQMSLFSFIVNGSVALGFIFSPWILRKWDPFWMIILGVVLQILGVGILLIKTQYGAIILGGVVQAMGTSVAFAPLLYSITKSIAIKHQGYFMSITGLLISLAWLITSFTAHWTIGIHRYYLGCLFFLVISLFFAFQSIQLNCTKKTQGE